MCNQNTISGIIIGASGGLMIWSVGVLRELITKEVDKKRVHNWLKKNIPDQHGNRFHSTKTIASFTNLTHDRVRYICSIHKKIHESTGEKDDLWSIRD